MRVNAKGQVTIPASIRRSAGLTAGTEVFVGFDGRTISIYTTKERRLRKQMRTRLNRLLNEMPAYKATKMTTDEIMAMTRGR